MSDAEDEEVQTDLQSLDPNIHSLWNIIKSKPSIEDIDANEKNKDDYEHPMSTRGEVLGWLIWDFSNGPQFQVFVALTWTLFLIDNATQYGCETYTPYGCDINNDPIASDIKVTAPLLGGETIPESIGFIANAFSGIYLCIYLDIVNDI